MKGMIFQEWSSCGVLTGAERSIKNRLIFPDIVNEYISLKLIIRFFVIPVLLKANTGILMTL